MPSDLRKIPAPLERGAGSFPTAIGLNSGAKAHVILHALLGTGLALLFSICLLGSPAPPAYVVLSLPMSFPHLGVSFVCIKAASLSVEMAMRFSGCSAGSSWIQMYVLRVVM